MSTKIEIKRKELELDRIVMARKETEFKILEREEEIARLRASIDIQVAREAELKQELEEMKDK